MHLRELFPNIYTCGTPSEKTFGAHSYFLRTKEGNVLVDVPEYEPAVVDALEKAGGVAWIFVSHWDDYGDTPRFQNKLGSKVVMHSAEVETFHCHVDISFDRVKELTPQIKLIPTPGHSPGSSSLLYNQSPGFLFTGDHLMGTRKDAVLPAKFSWTHDWEQQLKSAWGLLDFDFDVVLPAHHSLQKGYEEGAKQSLRGWLENQAKTPPR